MAASLFFIQNLFKCKCIIFIFIFALIKARQRDHGVPLRERWILVLKNLNHWGERFYSSYGGGMSIWGERKWDWGEPCGLKSWVKGLMGAENF